MVWLELQLEDSDCLLDTSENNRDINSNKQKSLVQRCRDILRNNTVILSLRRLLAAEAKEYTYMTQKSLMMMQRTIHDQRTR